MTTAQDLSKAKAAARRRARTGKVTHQQALDAIARERGHAHWGAMAADHEATKTVSIDDKALRGPSVMLPSELDELLYLQPPGENVGNGARSAPTLYDVERNVQRITERAAANQAASQAPVVSLSTYIAKRMKDAADKAAATRGPASPNIKPIEMSSANIAYAMDPAHGPYEDHDRIMVRCPVHSDKTPSLLISGNQMRCLAGCDDTAVRHHLAERLMDCAKQAVDFMVANDKSLVIEGWSNNMSAGTGGMGGSYKLTNKKIIRLETLVCRMLGDDYPKWDLGT